MLSSSKAVLDTALNQSGIRVSPEIVEDVLMERFKNAGMLAFCFAQMGWKSREVTSKNIRAYHTKIESLAKPRQRKIMRDLVNAMRNKRMLNVETFWFIMRKHARVQKVEKGRQFAHLMPCRNMMYPNI